MSNVAPTPEHLLTTPERENDIEYCSYRDYVVEVGKTYDIPDEHLYPALELWTEHYRADQESAKGTVKSIPIALAVAEVFNEELGDPTEEGDVIIETLIHDCGKPKVGKTTLDRSNRGVKDWNKEVDMSIMKPHALYGAILIMFSDLPMKRKVSAAKVTAESHAKQEEPYSYIEELNYLFPEEMAKFSESENPNLLSFRERRRRDCKNIGDYVDAILTRHTTMNSGMSWEMCWLKIRAHIGLLLNDYDNSWELSEKVYARVWTMYPQTAAQLTARLGATAMAA